MTRHRRRRPGRDCLSPPGPGRVLAIGTKLSPTDSDSGLPVDFFMIIIESSGSSFNEVAGPPPPAGGPHASDRASESLTPGTVTRD